MNKLFSVALIIAMLTSLCVPVVATDRAGNDAVTQVDSVGMGIELDSDLIVVNDQERNERINALFALRSELELDYEANEQQIKLIDEQLTHLGVESITHGELLSKLGVDAGPNVSVTSTSTTKWTSRRTIVTYRGQHYELQIIEGVPISGDSPLRDDQVIVDYEAEGFCAGITNFVGVSFDTSVGLVPVVGNFYSVFNALCDTVEGFADAYNESIIIDKMTGTAVVSLTTHMKYIFVKGYGSSDSYQVLCYVGNSVSFLIATVSAVDIYSAGVLNTFHSVKTYEVTQYSEHYNDYTVATNNYCTYRESGSASFVFYYYLRIMNITILGDNRALEVPYEEASIIG